eukprot:2219704-Pleurochrysis_carterae.AAC.1
MAAPMGDSRERERTASCERTGDMYLLKTDLALDQTLRKPCAQGSGSRRQINARRRAGCGGVKPRWDEKGRRRKWTCERRVGVS